MGDGNPIGKEIKAFNLGCTTSTSWESDSSMILSDTEILSAVNQGDIQISPFRAEMVNPVSVDLTLGSQVSVYRRWVTSSSPAEDGTNLRTHSEGVLDTKEEPGVLSWEIGPSGWLLRPGIGYLMHTHERVWTRKYVPILDGKSSIGRLFIQVHATAGFGDPNFDGQFTLEVIVQHPVRVYAGMRICQIRFQTIQGQVENPYNGNYKGESAQGAVASRCWKQFLPKSPDTVKPPPRETKELARLRIQYFGQEAQTAEELIQEFRQLQESLQSWYGLSLEIQEETLQLQDKALTARAPEEQVADLILNLPRLCFSVRRLHEQDR